MAGEVTEPARARILGARRLVAMRVRDRRFEQRAPRVRVPRARRVPETEADMTRHVSIVLAAALAAGASSGVAQSIAYEIDGEHVGDRLGFSVALIGDVNADGFDDWIAGQPGSLIFGPLVPGSAIVSSGLTGAVLLFISGEEVAARNEFGRS